MPQHRSHAELEKENQELRKTIGRIRESEQVHRVTLENLSDTVLITNDHGEFIYVCPNISFIFGMSPDEVEKTGNIMTLLGGSVCEPEMVREQAEIQNIEWSVQSKTGQALFLLIHVKSVDIKGGTLLYAIRDITNIKTAQQKLATSENMLSAIVEGLSDPMIVLDNALKLRFVNTAALKYYGISPESDFENSYCYEVLKGRSECCEECRAKDAIAASQAMCYERNGFIDPAKKELVTISPATDPASGDNYVSVRVNDITNIRNVETELMQADKMIKMGMLLAGLAHEINNPNNSILLNTQLLIKSWPDIAPVLDTYSDRQSSFSVGGLPYDEMKTELPEIMAEIERSSHSIKQIINDLKHFSRKNEKFEFRELDINQVIEDAARLTRKRIEDATSRFSITLDRAIPRIKGSRQGLQQVLVNLIENACQAVDGKHKKISVTSGMSRTENAVFITVADQGKGVPKENLARVFDPFFTTKKRQGGIGLGLFTSSDIVRKHGGTIKLRSTPAEGSVFKVVLPVMTTQTPVKILIADDDPASRQILVDMIARLGNFKIVDAGSGAEVLYEMGRQRPDLLVLDVHMPGIDGYEVCKVIQNTTHLHAMKVLIVTGLINSNTTRQVMDMGYGNILEKPVDKKDLYREIQTLLEKTP